MQILTFRSGHCPESHLVLCFGLGMIGSSIRDGLNNLGFGNGKDIDFNWQNPASWNASFESIRSECHKTSAKPSRLSIIWSAGRGGFHCTEDEAAKENSSFEAVVSFCSKFRDETGPGKFDFQYISSAGGLFEGQRAINLDSVPKPIRPYGKLKLNQELTLRKRFEQSEISIYRPSSVYGPMVQKSQQGLINNLVSNGQAGRVTVLDSHVMSLRDYVYTGDIGKYVAGRVHSESSVKSDDGTYFLVSSRCSSIFEVVNKIERTLKLKLHYRYDPSFGNNRNITFSDRILPSGWLPVPLDVGLRQFMVRKFA